MIAADSFLRVAILRDAPLRYAPQDEVKSRLQSKIQMLSGRGYFLILPKFPP
jgi:hypothetical protein